MRFYSTFSDHILPILVALMPQLKNLPIKICIHFSMYIASEVAFWLPMAYALGFMPNQKEDIPSSCIIIAFIVMNICYMLINNVNHLNWIYSDISGVSNHYQKITKFLCGVSKSRIYFSFSNSQGSCVCIPFIFLGKSIDEYCNNEVNITHRIDRFEWHTCNIPCI